MPPLSRVDSASHRQIYAGHVHQAAGVVLGYPSHQTIAPVRGHARQRAHSGIEGGPWSTWTTRATKPRHLQLADLRRIRIIRPTAPRNPAFGRVGGENGLAESSKRASEMSEGVEGPAPLRTRRPRCGDTAAKALPAIWTPRGTMPRRPFTPSPRIRELQVTGFRQG